MRKILTLHIPITEYDTLGSESDNDVTTRTVNQSKYRRGKQFCFCIRFFVKCFFLFDLTKDPQQETTSSSSETSPGSMSRKPKSAYLARKPGKSTQNLSKRHVRSSSGYSSHNEETTFR